MATDPINSVNQIPGLGTGAGAPASGSSAPKDEKLLEACQQFEAIFVNYMLQKMRETVPDGGLTEKGAGESVYSELLDQEYSKVISDSRTLGLSNLLYQQLTGQFDTGPKGDLNG